MPIEPLVRQVDLARRALDAAEHAARHKRSEYHASIGALRHAGLTIREIGKAIDLSHQRVQQIVDALACSFCTLTADQVPKLVAGGHKPGTYICDRCIGRATLAFRTRGAVEEVGVVMDLVTTGLCDFCGCAIGASFGRRKVDGMALHNATRICRPCVAMCTDILEAEWKQAKKALYRTRLGAR